MKSLAICLSNLKVLVLAGSMLLVPAAVAQQEVSPDIYPDHSPKATQTVKPAAHAKQDAKDARKIDVAAKSRKASGKKADGRKQTGLRSSKNVTLAQAR